MERHLTAGRSAESLHAFVLDGGFSSFYSLHPELCVGEYVVMSAFAKLAAKYEALVVAHCRFSEPRRLATGRTACVRILTDRETSRECVGKVLDESKAGWVIAFSAEVHTLARCRGAPNIAEIIGFTTESPFMVVLKYYAGGTLEQRLVGLTATQKAEIALKVALALRTLHWQGLVHRDFRAANIFVDSCGEPMLADFGSTRHVKDLPKEPAELATLWEAPEALQGCELGQAIDVYAFGMLLWVMYNEDGPFAGETPTADDIVGGRRPAWKSGTPPALVDLANRCWDADKFGRPTAAGIVCHLCENLRVFGECDENVLMRLVRNVRAHEQTVD
jgi:serine/threonine protein kinase